MEEDLPESSLNDELQSSKTEVAQKKDQNLDRQQNPESPEGLRPDLEHHSPHSGPDQLQDQNNDKGEPDERPPDPPQDQQEVQDQSPAAEERGSTSGEESDVSRDHRLIQDQDQDLTEQKQDPGQRDQNQDQDRDQDRDQDPMTPPANQEACVESGGVVPALVITRAAEQALGSGPAVTPEEPPDPQRPADLMIPLTPSDPGLSPGSDGGDMSCSDLLSLRSDSLSLASEPALSKTSEDEDSRSVAASSVMSLFHRVQLDPLEKAWLRSSALGNMAAQRQLLSQESSLVLKKDFITTALHWAAKQGCQEAVDMMIRSGADVNVRSGYTPLHLASIHGHQHVVHTLINTYNAKTDIRDYHGKTADHYWSGSADVFTRPDAQTGGRFHRGRQTQRYALPSLLLSRSRSQGQLNLDFRAVPPSASHDVSDLRV